MTRGNDYDGTLINVEGIDGAGKSSIVDAIAAWADDADVDLTTSKEPTDLWTGDVVYDALSNDEVPALADFALFVADRVTHVERRVKPVLERGGTVVTDRYADSTRAYQTHRIADETGMTYDEARTWMETVFEPFDVEPDLTIYVDIPVDVALDRAATEDKYERRENLERVKRAYDEMYGPCDPSVRIVDGTQSLSAVKHKAVNAVKQTVVERDPPEDDGRRYAAAAIAEETGRSEDEYRADDYEIPDPEDLDTRWAERGEHNE